MGILIYEADLKSDSLAIMTSYVVSMAERFISVFLFFFT